MDGGKNMKTIYLRHIETEVGVLTLASTERGICRLDFPGKSRDHILFQIERFHGPCKFWDENISGKNSLINQRAEREIDDYFDRKLKAFTVPLDVKGTEFQMGVWRELSNIPYGQTASYKDIAMAIGNPKAFRAVGGANNKNPVVIIIPCHRVVGQDGSLTGFGGGLETKKYLLDLETSDTRL